MRTETINIFRYSELSEEAKKVALEEYRDINIYEGWWDPIYEGFKEDAKQQGFNVDRIYFSGFHSQGDGAMFEGAVNSNFKFKGIRPIVQKLIDTKLITFYSRFTHSGHYYHHKSYHNIFDIDFNKKRHFDNLEDYLYGGFWIETMISDKYEELCKELYSRLQKYYYELISDEEVAEAICANGYEFYESGKIY